MRPRFLKKFVNIIKTKIKKKYYIIYFLKIRNGIYKNIKLIKDKTKKRKKIKVAFLSMYVTDCQNLSIFEAMNDEKSLFEPYLVINPDIQRSKENFDYNYKKTKDELINKYGQEKVLDGYDYAKNEFIDYTDQFDMATTSNPYDNMAHDYFKVSYWAKKGIPLFYISYFYMGRCFVSINNLQSDAYSYFWRIFVENEYVKQLAKKHEIIKGKNIVVTGSPKMDRYANIKPIPKQRKMIIIAPHHTIDADERSVGGFLQYSDILLKLPQRHKNIDFIFRPHPLLFENLRTNYWGREKSDAYLEELLSNRNVKYSTEGDYLELFANSDALIHDCGSFSAEYLYTGKPCAFMHKKGINPDAIWTDFGKKCIGCHYLIKSLQDLENFIENVVINGNDYLKNSRQKFTKESVAINYPNSTKFIINNILGELH